MSQDLATIRPKGNATVPGSAPFLPAQAFVDNITQFANLDFALSLGPVLTGITSISFSSDPANPDANKGDAVFLQYFISAQNNTVDFSSCPLVVGTVNSFLAFCVANAVNITTYIIIMTGMPAAPTGQGITDKATLNGEGWTVTTN